MNNEEMKRYLRELCRIESVAGIDVSDDAPYGAGCAQALDYALELCRRLGFETKLCENHRCGWAQIGAGETVVGILAHLDVVPAGSGWSHPAYDLTEENGRLYGRGVSDDKGPTIACIYAMNDILDAGISLKRRVRIIFGQSEESGDWDDMAYYREHEELPVFGFTPDADFPAIYGEKRLLNYKLTMPLEESGLLDIRGGSASNVVPDHCEARLLIDGREKCITASGKASHASTPEDGENAIAALAEKLASPLPQSPFVRFYRDCIGSSLNGELMGCALADIESGKLTMNVGTIGVTDGSLVMEIDVRAPVTFEADAVTEPLRRAAAEYGIEVTLTQDTPPVYMDKNGNVRPVDTRKHTPKKAEQARMSSLRRLGIHKVCLRRRALTSHLLRLFLVLCSFETEIFCSCKDKVAEHTVVFSRLWTPQGRKRSFQNRVFSCVSRPKGSRFL